MGNPICPICGREGCLKPFTTPETCYRLGYERSQEALAAANARVDAAEADLASARLVPCPACDGECRCTAMAMAEHRRDWKERCDRIAVQRDAAEEALAAARRECEELRDALEKAADGLRHGEAADLSPSTAELPIVSWRAIRDAYHAARKALAAPAAPANGRKHWPDCALNHGGTECDMGPDCGAATAAGEESNADLRDAGEGAPRHVLESEDRE